DVDGPSIGKIETEYTYSCSVTVDPDNEPDELYYLFDWGDNTDSGWIKPLSSSMISTSHVWYVNGSFKIKVKAKDIFGAESEWSEPLEINMPKNKIINDLLVGRLLIRFPIFKFFLWSLLQ
ncbi:MAG: hypothetical protein V3S79_03110, partial [Candidatus Thermoplasmatota archaeon]